MGKILNVEQPSIQIFFNQRVTCIRDHPTLENENRKAIEGHWFGRHQIAPCGRIVLVGQRRRSVSLGQKLEFCAISFRSRLEKSHSRVERCRFEESHSHFEMCRLEELHSPEKPEVEEQGIGCHANPLEGRDTALV